MITTGPLRRLKSLCQDWPMHSNALIYSGYAIAATLAAQTAEQWQDQPMNARKRGGGSTESPTGISRWTWSWQFRNGNDPNVMPIKDPSEPYYNLAISAYRDSPTEELLRKEDTTQIHECTFNFDLARVAGMIAWGSFFAGPANALLYPFYHRVFGATSAGVNRSVLFDQAFYMPFVSIPMCWYLNGFVKKWAMRDPRLDESVVDQQSPYSIEDCLLETTSEMKERWVSNVLLTMAIWIPAESINLRFTPLHLRSVVAGAVGLVWTSGMAALTNVGSLSLMESSMEPSVASSMESGMDSWVAIKDLLARVIDTHNV